MKIHENFHVKGIFQDDKSNRMNVYTHISGFSALGGRVKSPHLPAENFLIPPSRLPQPNFNSFY